jgi:hypothetical protein
MAAAVAAVDSRLPELGDAARLAALVPFGAACYAVLLFLFARPVVDEMVSLVRREPVAA